MVFGSQDLGAMYVHCFWSVAASHIAPGIIYIYVYHIVTFIFISIYRNWNLSMFIYRYWKPRVHAYTSNHMFLIFSLSVYVTPSLIVRRQASIILQIFTYATNLTLCNQSPIPAVIPSHTQMPSSPCLGSDSPVWIPSRPVQADSSCFFAYHPWLDVLFVLLGPWYSPILLCLT